MRYINWTNKKRENKILIIFPGNFPSALFLSHIFRWEFFYIHHFSYSIREKFKCGIFSGLSDIKFPEKWTLKIINDVFFYNTMYVFIFSCIFFAKYFSFGKVYTRRQRTIQKRKMNMLILNKHFILPSLFILFIFYVEIKGKRFYIFFFWNCDHVQNMFTFNFEIHFFYDNRWENFHQRKLIELFICCFLIVVVWIWNTIEFPATSTISREMLTVP
jgi:hypothetical protein